MEARIPWPKSELRNEPNVPLPHHLVGLSAAPGSTWEESATLPHTLGPITKRTQTLLNGLESRVRIQLHTGMTTESLIDLNRNAAQKRRANPSLAVLLSLEGLNPLRSMFVESSQT
jgi:hypothetical protein